MSAAYWIAVFLLGGLCFIGPAYAMGRRDARRECEDRMRIIRRFITNGQQARKEHP